MSLREPRTYRFGEEARFFERLIFSNRPVVVFLFLLVTLALLSQARQIRPDASFEKMIPQEHPYIQAMMRHLDDLGEAGTSIQIAVEAVDGSILTADYLETLQQVTDEALFLPGAVQSGVKSLWTPNVRWTEVTELGFDGGTVVPPDYDGSAESLDTLRRNIQRSGQVGRLVANDFGSSIVEVPLRDADPKTGERLDYEALSEALETRIRARFESDTVRIHITGFGKLMGELIAGIRIIAVFAGITLLVTALLLFAYSRCPIATLAPLVCSLVAVVWQLGLLQAFGYGINAYSMLVPFLVFAIGVSHGIQMVNAASIGMAEGEDRETAARHAYRALYVPGVVALVSDAMGFITLFLIDIEVIKELGIAASLGVAAVIFTNLVLLPVILSYFGICRSGIALQQRRRERTPWLWTHLSRLGQPRPAVVMIGVAAVLLATGVIGSRQVRIGDLDPGAPELKPDSRYNRDVRFINDHYAVSSDVFLVMVETEPEACSAYRNLALIDRFSWTMENVPGVQSAVSLVTVVKQVLMGFNEGNLKWYTLTRNQQALDNTFFAVPPQLMNRDCSFAPVVLFLEDHRADTLDRVSAAAEAFAGAHNSEQIRFVLASGSAGVEAATNQVIRDAQPRMLWLVYGVVCVLVLLSFGSPRAVVCIITPLIITSFLCQSLMALLGIGIKVATLPVIALGVGVGVDYGIYIYSRLEEGLREGMALPEAYFRALRTTGRAVVLTGITLAIGVATWVFSPIKFQADMGLLLVFMFLWNMVGAIALLPALACYVLNPERLADKGPR